MHCAREQDAARSPRHAVNGVGGLVGLHAALTVQGLIGRKKNGHVGSSTDHAEGIAIVLRLIGCLDIVIDTRPGGGLRWCEAIGR